MLFNYIKPGFKKFWKYLLYHFFFFDCVFRKLCKNFPITTVWCFVKRFWEQFAVIAQNNLVIPYFR